MSKTRIGEALRLYMDANEISVRSLASNLDMPPTTLQRFISGASEPSTSDFLKIMTWFTGDKEGVMTNSNFLEEK